MLMEAASAASSVFLYPQPAIFRRLHSLGGNRSAKTLLRRVPHLSRLSSTARAADSTQHAPPVAASSSKTVVPDNDFSLAKVSFGVIGLAVGGTLLSYGFGAYFTILPGSEWSALMLTYGFPLAIIGMALQYAELKPVPCITYSDAETLRETCATPILKQENGIVEKKNQTILDVAKTMPKSKDLLKELWAEVVDCAVYLLNWCPTKSLEYVTLQEAWSGRRVMFSYLEVFGRIAYSRPTKKEGKAR